MTFHHLGAPVQLPRLLRICFRKISLLLIAVCVAMGLGSSVAHADELWYSTLQWNGRSDTPRLASIRSVHDDGTGDVGVVNLGGDTTSPVPSPDGDWLYFQSDISGQYQVYRCRPDGTQVTNLSSRHTLGSAWIKAYGFQLSADGTTIVYTLDNAKPAGPDHLARSVVASSDGYDARFAAPELEYTYMASLDRTGGRVVLTSAREGYRLLTVHVASGSLTRLAPEHPNSMVPQLTPDGQTVIFLRKDGDLYSVGVDGSNLKRLTSGNDHHSFQWNASDAHQSTDPFHISPDGTRIAYVAKRNGYGQVHVMNVDGSNQRQVTFRTSESGRVRFSPDGKQLAFVSFVGTYPQLFVMNTDGTGAPRQLTSSNSYGVYWVQWKPAALLSVKNLTTKTTVFSDDFAHVSSVSQQQALDDSGDFDPVAVTGRWNVFEEPAEARSRSLIQVTNSLLSPDPGSIRGRNYLRLFRSMSQGVRGQDLSGVLTSPQNRFGDKIRMSMMVNVPNDGANARGQFLLLGQSGNTQTARAWVRPDGTGRVVAVGPGYSLRDTGVRYVPGVWQRWDLEYVIGHGRFSVAVNGVKASDLPSYSAGGVGSLYLFNGNDETGSVYIGGVIPAPTFSVKNTTTKMTVFADTFEGPAASHAPGPDLSGDFDPVATTGWWDIHEAGSAPGVQSMIQVTDSTSIPNPGAIPGTRYLRMFRSLEQGLNEQEANAVFPITQTTPGHVIRLSMMVYIPNDGANARGQFVLSGVPGNGLTARAWVRPDGAGNVISVGPGYALTNTQLRYTPGVWQRWDIEYAVGSSTFSVTVDGARASGLPAFSAGYVGAAWLFNGATSTGSIYVAGVPGE